MTEAREILPGLILPPLNTRIIGHSIKAKHLVASTNNLALRQGEHGTVFVAEQQLAGRGRHGNTWYSPPGLGLMFSVALDLPARGLMFAAALAVRDAIRPRLELVVKWPNDLLWHNKKVCGILVEHRNGRSAVGIGLNVSMREADFPESLQGKATSLEAATNSTWERGALLAEVLTTLDHFIQRLEMGHESQVHRDWVTACDLLGQHIERDGVRGRVRDIAPDGTLHIETRAGIRQIVAGGLFATDGLGA